jgi:hypothetical protein
MPQRATNRFLLLFGIAPLLAVGVAHAQLDVPAAGLTIAALYNASDTGSHGPAVILEVWEGTEAAKRGLQRGDVIFSLNGTAVGGKDLREAMRPALEAQPGAELRFTYMRPIDGMRQLKTTLHALAAPPLRRNPGFEAFGYQVSRSWSLENYSFPLPWAPDIAYQGIEDVLFAPAFAQRSSAQYHALVWFWWLDGQPTIDAGALREVLSRYFRGISQERGTNHGFTPDLGKVTVTIDRARPETSAHSAAATATYRGQMTTYNPEGELITLYVEAETPRCRDSGHTPILFRLATQPTATPVWGDLRTVTATFRCRRAGETNRNIEQRPGAPRPE